MYYGGGKKDLESRANVRLSRMQEFVHTLLSKIDNPLVFKFPQTEELAVEARQPLECAEDD